LESGQLTQPATGARLARPTSLRATEWFVTDFKALQYALLPLSSVNVIAGENSSGKSSLIQSLLMLAQSTEDELFLNGPLVRLGEPKDTIRSGSSTMSIGFTVQERRDEAQLAFDLTLKDDGGALVVSEFTATVDGEEALSASSKYVPSTTKAEVVPGDMYGESLLRVGYVNRVAAPPRTYLYFRGLSPAYIFHHRTAQQIFKDLRRNLKSSLVSEAPERGFNHFEQLNNWIRRESRKDKSVISDDVMKHIPHGRLTPPMLLEMPRHILDTLFRLYAASEAEDDEWLAVPIGRYQPYYRNAGLAPAGVDVSHETIWHATTGAAEGLESIRNSIRYLGPLREEPQVVSPTGARYRSLPAGSKGEFTADLLAREKGRYIRFGSPERGGGLVRATLPTAVSMWTEYLGVGDAVAVEDQGKLGRGLRVKVNGAERDLTMIGVGASQILPVLAVVLSAEGGSIVMLEQPELHLHPAVQSRLADFFLFARTDLRLVVETHSEYMITRMRRRIAEGHVDPERVALLFAEQQSGVSELRQIALNQLGDLSVWPEGFFDTQDKEGRALVRAVHKGLKNRGDKRGE
jgi:predicted ATPase